MIPWAEAEASGLLFALMPCITSDCNFPLHVGKQFQLTNCWLLVLYIPLTLEKCSELVLTWMGWKGDLFCQNLCLVQLEVHVDEGPGGDGSMCVCQLPWFLLFLKYPAVTSVSRTVRGEDIFFFYWQFPGCRGLSGCFWLVDDLEEVSPILDNYPMCSHVWLPPMEIFLGPPDPLGTFCRFWGTGTEAMLVLIFITHPK